MLIHFGSAGRQDAKTRTKHRHTIKTILRRVCIVENISRRNEQFYTQAALQTQQFGHIDRPGD